jgi:hypothetical protein
VPPLRFGLWRLSLAQSTSAEFRGFSQPAHGPRVATCEIKLLHVLTGLEAERIFMLRAVTAMNAMRLSLENQRVMPRHGNSGGDNSATLRSGKIKPNRVGPLFKCAF